MYSLSHIGIRCQDLDRSLHFYVDALGGLGAVNTGCRRGPIWSS